MRRLMTASAPRASIASSHLPADDPNAPPPTRRRSRRRPCRARTPQGRQRAATRLSACRPASSSRPRIRFRPRRARAAAAPSLPAHFGVARLQRSHQSLRRPERELWAAVDTFDSVETDTSGGPGHRLELGKGTVDGVTSTAPTAPTAWATWPAVQARREPGTGPAEPPTTMCVPSNRYCGSSGSATPRPRPGRSPRWGMAHRGERGPHVPSQGDVVVSDH